MSTLLGLIAAGFGITVLARSLAALHLDNLVYLPLSSPGAVSRLWLIHHRNPSPACRRLVDIVTGSNEPQSNA